jgi:hypothetical protein
MTLRIINTVVLAMTATAIATLVKSDYYNFPMVLLFVLTIVNIVDIGSEAL